MGAQQSAQQSVERQQHDGHPSLSAPCRALFAWQPPSPLAQSKALACPDIFSALPDSVSHARALVLEPADPLTLIASIAGAPAHLQQLDVVLTHSCSWQLARVTLLLLLVAELDPGSEEHMAWLWDVLANAVWSNNWWPHISAYVKRLSDDRHDLPLTLTAGTHAHTRVGPFARHCDLPA